MYTYLHLFVKKTETYVVASDSSHDLHNIALILLSKAESNFDTGSSPTSHPHASAVIRVLFHIFVNGFCDRDIGRPNMTDD